MKTEPVSSKQSESHFRLWLQSELTERCRRNPKYSLRAFAVLLKMDASSVSQILSGKRSASSKLIERICERLGASPVQKSAFVEQARQKKTDFIPTENMNFEMVALDAFAVIADWYHYGILELTSVDGFRNDPSWIARSLGISMSEAKIAVERLKRLDLVREENGRLVRTNRFVTNFAPGQTSAALKSLQKQVISMALDAVDNVDQDEKDITSITMAIDPAKLPEARKRIARFRRELCAFLEDGAQTRVYQMGLQLYPISKKLNEEK